MNTSKAASTSSGAGRATARPTRPSDGKERAMRPLAIGIAVLGIAGAALGPLADAASGQPAPAGQKAAPRRAASPTTSFRDDVLPILRRAAPPATEPGRAGYEKSAARPPQAPRAASFEGHENTADGGAARPELERPARVLTGAPPLSCACRMPARSFPAEERAARSGAGLWKAPKDNRAVAAASTSMQEASGFVASSDRGARREWRWPAMVGPPLEIGPGHLHRKR